MLSSKKLIMTESNVDWMQLIIDTTHGALDLYSAITKHWWGLLSIFHNVCIKSNSSHKQKKAEGMLWDLHCLMCVCYHSVVQWGLLFSEDGSIIEEQEQFISLIFPADKTTCNIFVVSNWQVSASVRYRIPLHHLKTTFLCTVLLGLSNDQGSMHSSDFIICIKSVLVLLCLFCHHAPLDQSTLMSVWHLSSDFSHFSLLTLKWVQSKWKDTGVCHVAALFKTKTLHGWSWNSSWMIPKLFMDE